jgi:hypothetical protein
MDRITSCRKIILARKKIRSNKPYNRFLDEAGIINYLNVCALKIIFPAANFDPNGLVNTLVRK